MFNSRIFGAGENNPDQDIVSRAEEELSRSIKTALDAGIPAAHDTCGTAVAIPDFLCDLHDYPTFFHSAAANGRPYSIPLNLFGTNRKTHQKTKKKMPTVLRSHSLASLPDGPPCKQSAFYEVGFCNSFGLTPFLHSGSHSGT